jgi:hypothetical protein
LCAREERQGRQATAHKPAKLRVDKRKRKSKKLVGWKEKKLSAIKKLKPT